MTLPTMRKTNLGDRSKQGTATTTTSKTLPRQEKLNAKSSRNGATSDKKNDLKKDLDRKDLDRKYLNSSKVGKKENININNRSSSSPRIQRDRKDLSPELNLKQTKKEFKSATNTMKKSSNVPSRSRTLPRNVNNSSGSKSLPKRPTETKSKASYEARPRKEVHEYHTSEMDHHRVDRIEPLTSKTTRDATTTTPASTTTTATTTMSGRPVQKVAGVVHSHQLHHVDEGAPLRPSHQEHKTTMTATTTTTTTTAKDKDEGASDEKEINSKSDSQTKPHPQPPGDKKLTKIQSHDKSDEQEKLTVAENLTRAWVLNEGKVVHGETWTSRVRQPFDRDVVERRDDDRRPERYRRRYDDAAIRNWTFKNRRSSVDKAMDFWTCLFCCCS